MLESINKCDRKFILRVQTDGSITPRMAVIQACKDLISDLNILNREFTKEWELRKMVRDRSKGAVNGVGVSDGIDGLGEL